MGRSARPMTFTPLSAAATVLLAGSYYAPKDFMQRGAARWITRAVGTAASAGLFAYSVSAGPGASTPSVADASADTNAGPHTAVDTAAPESAASAAVDAAPVSKDSRTAQRSDSVKGKGSAAPAGSASTRVDAKQAGILAGVFSLLGVSIWAQTKFDNWIVGKLRKWGVKMPNTAWGAVNVVAAFMAAVFDDSVKLSGFGAALDSPRDDSAAFSS